MLREIAQAAFAYILTLAIIAAALLALGAIAGGIHHWESTERIDWHKLNPEEQLFVVEMEKAYPDHCIYIAMSGEHFAVPYKWKLDQ